MHCSIGCVHRSSQGGVDAPHISFEMCDDTSQYQVGTDVPNPVVPLPMDFELDPLTPTMVLNDDFGVDTAGLSEDDEWHAIDNLIQDGVKNSDFIDFFPENMWDETALELPLSPCDVQYSDFVWDNSEEKDFFLSFVE